MYYKELYTTKPGGELPQLVSAENENLQSRYVVRRIHQTRAEGQAIMLPVRILKIIRI